MTKSSINKKILDSPLLNQSDIDFIIKLAQEAGDIALSMKANMTVKTKSNPYDFVTDADITLSKLLLNELNKKFPSHFLVSEEESPHPNLAEHVIQEEHLTWLIDPIDGTDNYIHGDDQYAVMLGLLVNGQAHFGCVHAPETSTTYYGGPNYGAVKIEPSQQEHTKTELNLKANYSRQNITRYQEKLSSLKLSDPEFSDHIRVMIGSRDRKNNPWINELENIEFITSGSVGLKVAKVINDQADLFVHFSGKLKLWDTAGPVAIALAAGLEVGTLEQDFLTFPLPEIMHREKIIIGRPGSIEWARKTFTKFLS